MDGQIVSIHDYTSDDKTGQDTQNDSKNHCPKNVHLLISDVFYLFTNLCCNFGRLYYTTLNLSVQRHKPLVPSIVTSLNKINIEVSGQTDVYVLIHTNELQPIRESVIKNIKRLNN